MIKNKIVFSVTVSKLEKKILEHAHLAPAKAIDICRAQTLAPVHVLAMAAEALVTLHAIAEKQKQQQSGNKRN